MLVSNDLCFRTHGFDDEGRQYDQHGDLSNWWDNATEIQFLQRAQCIIDQYSNFTEPLTNLTVSISVHYIYLMKESTVSTHKDVNISKQDLNSERKSNFAQRFQFDLHL